MLGYELSHTDDGRCVFVNPFYVVSVTEMDDENCMITFAPGSIVHVKGSAEQVSNEIDMMSDKIAAERWR